MIKKFLPLNKGADNAINITHEMVVKKLNEIIEYINAREKKEENRITQQQTNTGWYEIL